MEFSYLGFLNKARALSISTCSTMPRSLPNLERSLWVLAMFFSMLAAASSSTSANTVGTGPASTSPSHMLASSGQVSSRMVGT